MKSPITTFVSAIWTCMQFCSVLHWCLLLGFIQCGLMQCLLACTSLRLTAIKMFPLCCSIIMLIVSCFDFSCSSSSFTEFLLSFSLCALPCSNVCAVESVCPSKSKEKISRCPKTEEWIKHFNYLLKKWMANRSASALLPKMASLSLKPRCVITLINTNFVFGLISSRRSRSSLWQYAKMSIVFFMKLETPNISV